MAETRANIDMEDVLSSIRRLVSEEPPRPRRPDVLVLTPALRVVEGSAPPRPAPQPSYDAEQGWPAGLPFRESLQASPVRLADFALPETDLRSSGQAASEAAYFQHAPTSRAKAPAAAPETASEIPMPDEAEIAAFFSSRSRSEISLEERIADLQAAIAQTGAEFEPDGSEAPERLDPAIMRRSDEDYRASATNGADPVPPEARFTAARHQPRIEEAVEVTGPSARRETRSQPAPEAQYEEALIDEDSLREIVADLVRQELRGELGERITRNVRSLIRRELNRALALRDLSDEK